MILKHSTLSEVSFYDHFLYAALVKDVSFIIDFLPQKNRFIINNNEQFTNNIYKMTKTSNGFQTIFSSPDFTEKLKLMNKQKLTRHLIKHKWWVAYLFQKEFAQKSKSF